MLPSERYIFYKDRPEWADVIPVPQDEGRQVVKIAYTPEFKDATDYLRAVLLKDERSHRALGLTETVVLLNPANYTAWEYRRRIAESLGIDMLAELRFIGRMIDENPKNYQVWHHRQRVVEKLAEASIRSSEEEKLKELGYGELEFIEKLVSDDSKNHHAWQYRRWVVNFFKIPPENELHYTEELIAEDMYNNSAWNHRFATVTRDERLTPPVFERELKFVQSVIRLSPNNESAWNYLYGLTVPLPCVSVTEQKHSNITKPLTTVNLVNEITTSNESVDVGSANQSTVQLVTVPPQTPELRMMRQFAEDLAKKDSVAADSACLLGFLVEVYTDCLQYKLAEKSDNDKLPVVSLKSNDGDIESHTTDSTETPQELLQLALATCDRLATEVDRIRANYWKYRFRQLVSIAAEAGLSYSN